MVRLIDEKRLALFPAGTIVRPTGTTASHCTGVNNLTIQATKRTTNTVLRNANMTHKDILTVVTGV